MKITTTTIEKLGILESSLMRASAVLIASTILAAPLPVNAQQFSLDPEWTEESRTDSSPQAIKWRAAISRAKEEAEHGKKDESLTSIRVALFAA